MLNDPALARAWDEYAAARTEMFERMERSYRGLPWAASAGVVLAIVITVALVLTGHFG